MGFGRQGEFELGRGASADRLEMRRAAAARVVVTEMGSGSGWAGRLVDPTTPDPAATVVERSRTLPAPRCPAMPSTCQLAYTVSILALGRVCVVTVWAVTPLFLGSRGMALLTPHLYGELDRTTLFLRGS